MKKKQEIMFVIFLLTVFTLLAAGSMVGNSATFDEPNIITSGYSYWKTGDYRLTFEHPPLAKLIAGFPLLLMNPPRIKVLNGPSIIPAKPKRVFCISSIFPFPISPTNENLLTLTFPTK